MTAFYILTDAHLCDLDDDISPSGPSCNIVPDCSMTPVSITADLSEILKGSLLDLSATPDSCSHSCSAEIHSGGEKKSRRPALSRSHGVKSNQRLARQAVFLLLASTTLLSRGCRSASAKLVNIGSTLRTLGKVTFAQTE